MNAMKIGMFDQFNTFIPRKRLLNSKLLHELFLNVARWNIDQIEMPLMYNFLLSS